MTKTKISYGASGRFVVVSLLTAGFLLAGTCVSWADRDGRHERRGDRYEMRKENRQESRHDGRFERSAGHRRHEVRVVRELPRGYRTVVIKKTPYYVHEHRYYSRVRNGYALIRPPVGALFATLPLGSVSVTIGGNLFFRADDVYYRHSPRGYIVVSPPMPVAPAHGGAVVVLTTALNVRSGPGERFPVIGRAWEGETLLVDGHAPGWYYVRLPSGASGWVMSGYTQILAAG